MEKLTYLAVCESAGAKGYGVYFPDLPGCISYGDDLAEAQANAKEALELHIYGMQVDGDKIPKAKLNNPKTKKGDIVIPVSIYPELVKNEMDQRRIRINCTIPAYLKQEGENEGINFSQLLECALKDTLNRNRKPRFAYQ